jgi:hypothetical protein
MEGVRWGRGGIRAVAYVYEGCVAQSNYIKNLFFQMAQFRIHENHTVHGDQSTIWYKQHSVKLVNDPVFGFGREVTARSTYGWAIPEKMPKSRTK